MDTETTTETTTAIVVAIKRRTVGHVQFTLNDGSENTQAVIGLELDMLDPDTSKITTLLLAIPEDAAPHFVSNLLPDDLYEILGGLGDGFAAEDEAVEA